MSDPGPSAASRIQFCRTAFSQVHLGDKREDYALEFVSDRSMHEEEAIPKKKKQLLDFLKVKI